VTRLNPLLHIDPVLYLPPEVTFEIFSYLEPHQLLVASTLSKSWRARTLDSRLWRKLFGSEGWNPNHRQVKDFEEEQREVVRRTTQRKSRARPSEAVTDAESKSPKRRVRERPLFGNDGAESNRSSRSPPRRNHSPMTWADQHDAVEADGDEKMDDYPTRPEDTDDVMSYSPSTPAVDVSAQDFFDPPLKPTLVLNSRADPSVNWQYLYKQKRRLEANWQAGRFKNFQLPHPKHPEEAHAECVYTIQYSGSHLVSGSRDKTLRIWNLETQRLAVKPLRGHDASVLCLQFDDRPEQDIVVSGGSDCHVILWRFSTGEMIAKMASAHSESVLNLRFDDRFLITCSKDKTIKVWNRKALLPTDSAYPSRGSSASAKFPAYILNIDNLTETELLSMKPLREYSLLMALEGHGAAVNAIQILDNQIVSASGDRQVKIWNVKTGECLKTISGHNKGIACVQFDGRRIVSGSSDETVRIFDRATGAEVACLKGHSNLVRTVQARFGDVPGSQEREEEEARAIDRKFLAAKLSGALSHKDLTREQRRTRNAGGRDVKDICAVGAKLPPGGGGSKWARIVSGSYDETVIIWRRGTDGKWTPAHQFWQWEAVLNAGGQPRHAPQHAHHPIHAHPLGLGQTGHAAATGQVPQAAQPPPNAATTSAPLTQSTQGGPTNHQQLAAASHQAQIQAAAHLQQAQAMQQISNAIAAQQQQAIVAAPSTTANNVTAITATSTAAGPSTQTAQPTPPPNQAHAVGAGQTVQQAIANLPPHLQAQFLAQQAGSAGAIHPHPLPHHPAQHAHGFPNAHPSAGHHPHGANGHGGNNGNNGTNSRVFKLQFDSRRIICCSQDPTIVGWDFANGDPDIEGASRFFGEDV
jgi:F-box and WD-40 domain protein 1/11